MVGSGGTMTAPFARAANDVMAMPEAGGICLLNVPPLHEHTPDTQGTLTQHYGFQPCAKTGGTS